MEPESCRFVVGDRDAEGRQLCRTCREYITVTADKVTNWPEHVLIFDCPRESKLTDG